MMDLEANEESKALYTEFQQLTLTRNNALEKSCERKWKEIFHLVNIASTIC